jgi:hypothetical protein
MTNDEYIRDVIGPILIKLAETLDGCSSIEKTIAVLLFAEYMAGAVIKNDDLRYVLNQVVTELATIATYNPENN